jgi:hypothetical protein
MAKITKVPNGPLIKKKGPFKGSTLKSGGPVKKKQGGGGFGNIMGMVGGLMGGGESKKDDSKKEDPLEATKNKFENSKNLLGNSLNKVNKQLVANQTPDVRKSLLKAGGKVKKGQEGTKIGKLTLTTSTIKDDSKYKGIRAPRVSTGGDKTDKGIANVKKLLKSKAGGMIKRADGSYSKRGLWDNLRSKAAQNKKTGAKPKAPTKAMLTQEKKIKSKTKK